MQQSLADVSAAVLAGGFGTRLERVETAHRIRKAIYREESEASMRSLQLEPVYIEIFRQRSATLGNRENARTVDAAPTAEKNGPTSSYLTTENGAR